MGATVRRNSLNLAILKLSGLFGGLQVTGILCSVVRSKLVAVWIGAAGMGLFRHFQHRHRDDLLVVDVRAA